MPGPPGRMACHTEPGVEKGLELGLRFCDRLKTHVTLSLNSCFVTVLMGRCSMHMGLWSHAGQPTHMDGCGLMGAHSMELYQMSSTCPRGGQVLRVGWWPGQNLGPERSQ